MANFVKVFGVLFLFVCLIHGGSSCILKINQEPTGVKVKGKPEYKVSMPNECPCAFEDIVLACDGFRTKEPIDHSILNQDGAECTINNGYPIYPNSALEFKYAWDKSYDFKFERFQIACS